MSVPTGIKNAISILSPISVEKVVYRDDLTLNGQSCILQLEKKTVPLLITLYRCFQNLVMSCWMHLQGL